MCYCGWFKGEWRCVTILYWIHQWIKKLVVQLVDERNFLIIHHHYYWFAKLLVYSRMNRIGSRIFIYFHAAPSPQYFSYILQQQEQSKRVSRYPKLLSRAICVGTDILNNSRVMKHHSFLVFLHFSNRLHKAIWTFHIFLITIVRN